MGPSASCLSLPSLYLFSSPIPFHPPFHPPLESVSCATKRQLRRHTSKQIRSYRLRSSDLHGTPSLAPQNWGNGVLPVHCSSNATLISNFFVKMYRFSDFLSSALRPRLRWLIKRLGRASGDTLRYFEFGSYLTLDRPLWMVIDPDPFLCRFACLWERARNGVPRRRTRPAITRRGGTLDTKFDPADKPG